MYYRVGIIRGGHKSEGRKKRLQLFLKESLEIGEAERKKRKEREREESKDWERDPFRGSLFSLLLPLSASGLTSAWKEEKKKNSLGDENAKFESAKCVSLSSQEKKLKSLWWCNNLLTPVSLMSWHSKRKKRGIPKLLFRAPDAYARHASFSLPSLSSLGHKLICSPSFSRFSSLSFSVFRAVWRERYNCYIFNRLLIKNDIWNQI